MSASPPGPPGYPFKGFNQKNLADEISKAIEGNECPSDESLGAFALKEMKERERIEVKSHLSYCGRCQKRLLAVLKPASGTTVAEDAEGLTSSGRFRLLMPPGSGPRRPRWIVVAACTAIAGVSGALFLATGGGDLGGQVVYAAGQPGIHARREFLYDVSLPQPGYLIQITIDGRGKVSVNPAIGATGMLLRRQDRVRIMPEAPGALDLTLAFVPGDGELPNKLLVGLKQFITSDKTLSRENQRAGIKTALKLYRLQSIEALLEVSP